MDRVSGSNLDTQLDLEGLPRHIELTDGVPTYQMKLSDHVLVVDSNTGEDDTGIVTLPSLAEAVGQFYYIGGPYAATHDDVSVYEKETGSSLSGTDINADGDYVIVFSTGAAWILIKVLGA